MSRRAAKSCPATPPKPFRASNSGASKTTRSPISGAGRLPSTRFAERNGWPSHAGPVIAGLSILAAAGAKLWRFSATRGRPILFAAYRRTTTSSVGLRIGTAFPTPPIATVPRRALSRKHERGAGPDAARRGGRRDPLVGDDGASRRLRRAHISEHARHRRAERE